MDNTALVVFSNEEFGKVRGLMFNGIPYFAGKDVAEVLEYQDTDKAIREHVDDDDKVLFKHADLAGLEYEKFTNMFSQAGYNWRFVPADIPNRGMYFINESGLYSLILSSRLPKAKEFRHWVTSEVLPSIRQTGGYVSTNTTKTDFVRFVETVTRLDPSVHKTVVDTFLGIVNTPDVPPKKEEPVYVEIKPTPMDSAIKTISVRQLIDDYLAPAGITAIPHPDGSVSKLCPKPVCQYLVKYHRDALPAQRNPSSSYKDRLVNTEKVDDIIKSLQQQQQLRHERSFVS